jgi:DNA (cytosine-5)-methyltransferase 1
MSSTYSAASGCSAWDWNGRDFGLSPFVRAILIAELSSLNTGPRFLAMATSENSTQLDWLATESPSMPSAEASPARISPAPARVLVLQARGAGCGANTADLLASLDRPTSSWKTSQRCLVEGWTPFSETWPRSGMTRNGTAYRLPTWAPLTGETESGLWPTPNLPNGGRTLHHVDQWKGTTAYHKGKKVQVDLNQMAKRWPTPHGFSPDGLSNGPSGNELGRAVNRRMIPTPKLPSGGGQTLRTTPGGGIRKLEDWVSADQGQNTGSLNPMWVEWLMGCPLGWTVLEPSETPLSRRSRKSSGKQS